MTKKIYFMAMALVLSVGFIACGDGDKKDYDHHKKVDNKKQKSDLEVDKAIVWEYDNSEGLKVHLDDTYIYLRYEHKSMEPNTQFFLDIDNNQETGVKIEEGADYMVENGWLFESVDDNSYGWKEMTEIDSTVIMGEYDIIKVPLNILKNKVENFRVNSQVLDDTWNPQSSSPSKLTEKSIYISN